MGHKEDMTNNFDDLDGRLRSAFTSTNSAPDTDVVSNAHTRRTGFLRSTRATMSSRSRRGVAGGAAAAAILALGIGSLSGQSIIGEPLIVAASMASSGDAKAMESMVTDSMMIPWVTYDYVAGDGLSTDAGRGHVYKLERTGTPEAVATAVAAALELQGTVQKSAYFDEQWPSYFVGTEDGTAESVSVTWANTGNWWYTNPAAYPQTQCPEVVAGEAEGATEPSMGNVEDAEGSADVSDGEVLVDPALECTEIPAKFLGPLPSDAEAARIAADLFSQTGLVVDAADVTVARDEWGVNAAANLVVAGEEIALTWMVNWAENGAIAYASGHSVTVVDKGEYSTVSAVDAVDRLDDWRWFGSTGPAFTNTHMFEPNSDVLRLEPSTDANGEIVPEVKVVTVDEMSATSLMMWDLNGDAWIVPGFATLNPDGWWNAVISLVEGIIELPEPMDDGVVAY
ncbi:MAG: hypothetical protein RIS25_90 [Actinomycetota bacterium]